MKILIAVLLTVHGLIVMGQSSGSFNPVGGVKNPVWLSWWPTNLGQSWLLTTLSAEQNPFVKAGGTLWLLAGLALVAAGLGIFGFIVPFTWWRSLAVSGAVISLILLAVYLHPFYGIGVGASALLLVALVWEQWPVLARLGL